MKVLTLVAVAVISALNAADLDRQLSEIAARQRLPGFAVAVVNQNEVLFQKGYGWADLQRKVAFTPQNVQNIGSISKTFIGVALMQLVEEKRIRLDDDINRYLPFKIVNPHFPNDAITIRHVATHNATFKDTNDFWVNDYVLATPSAPQRGVATVAVLKARNKRMPMEQFIRNLLAADGIWYSKSNFLKTRPGTMFQYSNLGAAVAAFVVERVSGDDFATYTEKRILQPIGMTQSGWSFDKVDLDQHVTQYISSMKVVPRYSLNTYPDGGMITSVADLSRFLIEMIRGYQGGSRLLRQESFREMMSSPWWKPGGSGYGIFWVIRPDGSIGHGGGDPGITTSMYFNPADDIGTIVFTNYTFSERDKDPARRQFSDVANALKTGDAGGSQ